MPPESSRQVVKMASDTPGSLQSRSETSNNAAPLFLLEAIDLHLDREVGKRYHEQPLAQDWARTAKVAEEAGEAIAELILWTQQNPRKAQRGDKGSLEALLAELADVVITGALAIQHFTKDAEETGDLLLARLEATYERIAAYDRAAKAAGKGEIRYPDKESQQ